MLLQEITQFDEAIKFDSESNICRNLKLAGLDSENSRKYTKKCMSDAVKLYENKAVYIDHSESKQRRYADRVGTLLNVKYEQGLRGDFSLNPKHELAEQIKWDIEHNTPNVGFSHKVDAEVREGKNSEVVKIVKVWSVDIVCDPAMTASFSEQTEEVNPLEEQINTLTKQISEIKEELNSYHEDLNKEKPMNYMELPRESKQEFNLDNWIKKLSKRI